MAVWDMDANIIIFQKGNVAVCEVLFFLVHVAQEDYKQKKEKKPTITYCSTSTLEKVVFFLV